MPGSPVCPHTGWAGQARPSWLWARGMPFVPVSSRGSRLWVTAAGLLQRAVPVLPAACPGGRNAGRGPRLLLRLLYTEALCSDCICAAQGPEGLCGSERPSASPEATQLTSVKQELGPAASLTWELAWALESPVQVGPLGASPFPLVHSFGCRPPSRAELWPRRPPGGTRCPGGCAEAAPSQAPPPPVLFWLLQGAVCPLPWVGLHSWVYVSSPWTS